MDAEVQNDLNEHLNKLGKFVEHEVDEAAKKCQITVNELLVIIEEVNIVRLHKAAHEALKKISYAVDLTPTQIYEVFTHHREASLADLVKRLHEMSVLNRSKF